MASEKWEVVIATCQETLTDASASLTDSIDQTRRVLEIVETYKRLSYDYQFDYWKCRGGDETMTKACQLDEGCSNCLEQTGGDRPHCIRNALLDKNEWYQLMGLDYKDGE